MYLTKLLEKTEYTLVRGTLDREIASLVYDSRKVGEGSLFVCISGVAVVATAFVDPRQVEKVEKAENTEKK